MRTADARTTESVQKAILGISDYTIILIILTITFTELTLANVWQLQGARELLGEGEDGALLVGVLCHDLCHELGEQARELGLDVFVHLGELRSLGAKDTSDG